MKQSIEDIGVAIKKARQEKGISQRTLSTKTKIPQGHISLIENGKVNLETSSLIEIVRALGMELMIVPRNLVPVIETLQRKNNNIGEEQIPLYRLDQEDEHDLLH